MRKFLVAGIMCLNATMLQADGLDLNPAVVDCIISGGECLKSIPIVGDTLSVLIFGGPDPVPDVNEILCSTYINDWCATPYYKYSTTSGYWECRGAKRNFFKAKQEQIGKWPDYRQLSEMYSHDVIYKEQRYLSDIEEKMSVGKSIKFFECTAYQQYIWLKNRCKDTQAYKKSTDLYRMHADETWKRKSPNTCGH